MGRKKAEDSDYEYIKTQLGIVLERVTDKSDLTRLKTWDDLSNVAYQWCLKNYKHYQDEAADWGVAPIYLLLTALLFVEHPLLMDNGRMRYGFIRAKAEILMAELWRVDVPIPILSTGTKNQPVEETALPVEEMK